MFNMFINVPYYSGLLHMLGFLLSQKSYVNFCYKPRELFLPTFEGQMVHWKACWQVTSCTDHLINFKMVQFVQLGKFTDNTMVNDLPLFTPQPLRLEGYCRCLGGRYPLSCECDNSLQIACIMLYLYRDVLYIKILDEFHIDLCVTFLNFQTSSMSSCLVNAITPQQFHASCDFIEIFSTSKSWTSSMLTVV